MAELSLPESPKEWLKTIAVGLFMSAAIWVSSSLVELKQTQDNGPLAREFRNSEMTDVHARLSDLERELHNAERERCR